MAYFTTVALFITTLCLRNLSNGACDNKVPLRTIARNDSAHSCPSKESERQAISAMVQGKAEYIL